MISELELINCGRVSPTQFLTRTSFPYLSPSPLPFPPTPLSYLVSPSLSLHLFPLHSRTLHTSAQLQIYQSRIKTNPSSTQIWKVEGVATVELGGLDPPNYVFDCNTTLNNGSGVGWTRLDGSHLNGLIVRPLINGKRLDAAGISYQHLGNYSCWDAMTNEQLTLRITDSKNTDIFTDRFSAGTYSHINKTLKSSKQKMFDLSQFCPHEDENI